MNSLGRIFRVSIYGESHGPEIGIIIDGCPAGIPLAVSDLETDIKRRSPGNLGTSSRIENDFPIIKSGVYNGFTSGTPILIAFANENINSSNYDFNGFFRPGHADFVAYKKYKAFNNPLGGGHFSGRLTLAIVAAGVVAKKVIGEMRVSAELETVGGSTDIIKQIEIAQQTQDSVGGIVKCTVNKVPVGLGEPFFDSAESLISHAIFSIPGVKAIEFGQGINASKMSGSEFNDVYLDYMGQTKTNNSGGINGGITNGNDLNFKVYIKPTSSISKPQETYNFISNEIQELKVEGRHDICFAQRTPVIVEAMTAIVLADLYLLSKV